jgi:glycosyltransferase involved in cell wall biosynthesis
MIRELPRVCFIAPNAFPLLSGDTTTARIGGAELQVVIVARLLARRGWNISMICLDYGQDDAVEIDGITVHRAFNPRKGLPVVRFVWPRLTSIWRCMRRADADIYYQQTAGMLTGVMAAFCRRNGRKSVFASASNPDLFSPTPRIRYLRDRWLYAYGMRTVDQIFVQNEEQIELCLVNYGRGSVLVRNCYAPPPSTTGGSEHPKSVLWVSTIRRIKRPEMFLELAEAMPHCEFTMIGGPGTGEYALYEEIERRAATLKNLTFRGFQHFARTEQEFDRVSVLVNTSESEGVPNAFLQAWARGIPTVSFIDAGARLEGRAVGVIVKEPSELAAAVGKLLANDDIRVREGLRGRDYVMKTHAPDAVVPVYEKEFARLAGVDVP